MSKTRRAGSSPIGRLLRLAALALMLAGLVASGIAPASAIPALRTSAAALAMDDCPHAGASHHPSGGEPRAAAGTAMPPCCHVPPAAGCLLEAAAPRAEPAGSYPRPPSDRLPPSLAAGPETPPPRR